MLVLSRKVGEQVMMGDSIVVTVLEVKGRHVRIGIEAPRNMRILRSELCSIDVDRSPSSSARELVLSEA